MKSLQIGISCSKIYIYISYSTFLFKKLIPNLMSNLSHDNNHTAEHQNEISDTDGDDVILHLPQTGKRRLWKFNQPTYLAAFLLFVLCYTFILFIFFYKQPEKCPELTPCPEKVCLPTQCPTAWSLSPSSQNYTTIQLNQTKVASILEPRVDYSLVPLILHFAAVLGDDWPFHIFHSAENLFLFTNSASIQKYVATGRFKLTQLPSNTTFKTRDDVSAFLTKRWLWDLLAPASYILFFQLDSMICSNSISRVEDFLQYDWVGAPWNETWGGNGGLSIRNRDKILQVIEKYNWTQNPEPEDVWYYKHIGELPNATLPHGSVSKTFSVEGLYYPKPLGYHQVGRYHGDKMGEVEQYCPENKLVTKQYV